MKERKSSESIIINGFFIVFSLLFVVPFMLILSISFSKETALQSGGYSLFPKLLDFTAYSYVFANPMQLVQSYVVTTIISVVTMFFGVLFMAMMAYSLSRSEFKFKKSFALFIYFTTIFNGGLIPTYIVITQYLGLRDNILVYILPSLCSAFYIIILRTFFKSLPEALCESATIDGASELRIFAQIIMPLSKPALASIALFMLLGKWNDWYTALIYIKSPELYSLQYLLQRILREAEFAKSMLRNMPSGIQIPAAPTETLKFAMCIVVAGPILLVFPFFQKYFAKGLTVGAVKG